MWCGGLWSPEIRKWLLVWFHLFLFLFFYVTALTMRWLTTPLKLNFLLVRTNTITDLLSPQYNLLISFLLHLFCALLLSPPTNFPHNERWRTGLGQDHPQARQRRGLPSRGRPSQNCLHRLAQRSVKLGRLREGEGVGTSDWLIHMNECSTWTDDAQVRLLPDAGSSPDGHRGGSGHQRWVYSFHMYINIINNTGICIAVAAWLTWLVQAGMKACERWAWARRASWPSIREFPSNPGKDFLANVRVFSRRYAYGERCVIAFSFSLPAFFRGPSFSFLLLSGWSLPIAATCPQMKWHATVLR